MPLYKVQVTRVIVYTKTVSILAPSRNDAEKRVTKWSESLDDSDMRPSVDTQEVLAEICTPEDAEKLPLVRADRHG